MTKNFEVGLWAKDKHAGILQGGTAEKCVRT